MNDSHKNLITTTSFNESTPSNESPPLIKKHLLLFGKWSTFFLIFFCIVAIIVAIVGAIFFPYPGILVSAEGIILCYIAMVIKIYYGLQVIVNFTDNTATFQVKSFCPCCNKKKIKYDRELIRGFRYELANKKYYNIFISLVGKEELLYKAKKSISYDHKVPEILSNWVISGN